MAFSRAFAAALVVTAVAQAPGKAAPVFSKLYSIPSSGDGCGSDAVISGEYLPPSQLVPLNGFLYGTTPGCGAGSRGTIFRYDPSSGTETVLYSFKGAADGGQPEAALTLVGSTLYGTTEGGSGSLGTVFKFDPAANTETVLHQFAGDGSIDGWNPAAPLLAFNGLLYGTTTGGGHAGIGAVFSIDPNSGAEQLVYSFTGGNDGAQPMAGLTAYNGLLYGTTTSGGSTGNEGTVFSIDPGTGHEIVLHRFSGGSDGDFVLSGLTVLNRLLYGTTANGGTGNNGVIYSIDPSSGAESVVYNFAKGSGFEGPVAGLLAVGNLLYGTEVSPSQVFAFNPATAATTTVYMFSDSNRGLNPATGLTLSGGLLYGADASYALSASGSLFAVDPNTGAETDLNVFTGPLGYQHAGLTALGGTLAVAGTIGGSAGKGGVFSVNPASGTGIERAGFPGGLAGGAPNSPVVQVGGDTYGTTQLGGTADQGTIFKIDGAGTTTILHSFSGNADGSRPAAGLTALGGKLYGSTSTGGTGGNGGTLFRLDPSTATFSTLLSFNNPEGYYPATALTAVGKLLYGTAAGGGKQSSGTVYSFDPSTLKVRLVHAFSKGDARFPSTPVVSFGGMLYGAADAGTTSRNGGAIYKIDLSSGTETVLYNLNRRTDGVSPSSLIALGTTLYGTTTGDLHDPGTVFRFVPATATLTRLYSFTAYDRPSDLIGFHGTLYGTTDYGGTAGIGMVFKLKP